MDDRTAPLNLPESDWHESRWSLTAPFVNSYVRFVRTLKRHPKSTTVITAVILFALFAERPYIQPYFVIAVRFLPGLLLAAGIAVGVWWPLKRYSVRIQAAGGAFALAIFAIIAIWGPGWHNHFAYWLRYQDLSHGIVDYQKGQFYRTSDDRVLPLGGVDGLIRDHVNDNELSSPPDYVRVGDRFGWTADIGPANIWGRFTHDITEIVFIPSSAVAPDFSRRTPVLNGDGSRVNFDVGEDLLFSRNLDTCVRRSFGPWKFINYEPGNVLRMKDDSGKWVYVVTLLRWSWKSFGFFPWPEFGGVQIIEQSGPHPVWHNWLVDWPKHIILGCGHWIAPEDVSKHEFLKGQNIVPYEASRFMAESNKFQAGFLGPTRYSRQGDVRIADTPEDLNLQPYVLRALPTDAGEWKLYQWFGLQPFDRDKCGLAISMLVPADGIGKTYRYNHAALKEAPIGPACVADKVRARQSDTYWANRRPAEPIPYVHDIADSNGVVAPRLMYKPVIVTQKVRKEGEQPLFIPGTPPETWIVDAYRGFPVAVGVDPTKWDAKLREELGSIWAEQP
jgi:hypothetical protein